MFEQTTLDHRKQIHNLKIGVKGCGSKEETQEVAEHNMETVQSIHPVKSWVSIRIWHQ
jgi:hypothetical protein